MSEKKKDPDLFAEIAEMKTDLAVLKNDVNWVKTALDDLKHSIEKLDKRMWTLVVAVLAFGVVSVLAALLS